MKLKRELKIIAASLGLGLTLAILVAAHSYLYADSVQRQIADNVIRFHVLAHSDAANDQTLKNHVRTQVLSSIEDTLRDSDCLVETRAFISANLHEIKMYAAAAVQAAGYNYPVQATLTTVFFPTRTYGELTFPPGQYEALQVIIGEGNGSNWWCLMFPPLCFMEMTNTPESRQYLEDALPTEGFRLLTHAAADETPNASVTVRFRVVEWWQNRRTPDTVSPPADIRTVLR